jgi:hypothetical protein
MTTACVRGDRLAEGKALRRRAPLGELEELTLIEEDID